MQADLGDQRRLDQAQPIESGNVRCDHRALKIGNLACPTHHGIKHDRGATHPSANPDLRACRQPLHRAGRGDYCPLRSAITGVHTI
jgi:hypothetical protein